MKSENISAGRLEKVTAGWVHGCNSVRNPWTLPEDQYKWGVNVQCRGGVVQTRPGFAMRLSLPPGNFQGGVVFSANKQAKASQSYTNEVGTTISNRATIYSPQGNEVAASELSHIVFAVNGSVYYSPFPLVQPKNWTDYKLTSIRLNPDADKVSFAIATQSAAITSSGQSTVTPSHRMLIVQDGISTPCYWDGSDTTGSVANDMPVGFWMAYSGSRLWIANANIIYASDLANPIGWSERESGAGRGDFSVARPVTAMQDYVGQNNDIRLYVFTDRSTYSLASGILDRESWPLTANFQSTLFPNIGCVAGKSIAFQAGQMWWYSQGGLVSVDVATSSYLSSQVLYKDIEMARAKRFMASDTSGIAAISFENYLLYSIPYLEPLNSATMVMDYAAASEWTQSRVPAWAGVWTGIRPIEWSSGVIDNQPRVFAFSVDYNSTSDGSYNHLWEAFVPERYDTFLRISQDGSTEELVSRIYCQMETASLGDKMDLKQLAYGELDCTQIAGTVDVRVSYRGSRGVYQSILDTRVLAATDSYLYENSQSAGKISELGFLQTQYRRLITENVTRTVKSAGCESAYTLDVDKCFSFLVEWCGAFGLEAIRMFQDPYPTRSVGTVTKPEERFCVVGENGESVAVDLDLPPRDSAKAEQAQWTSSQTKTVTSTCPEGGAPAASATATASFTSYISPQDAADNAALLAVQQAQVAIDQYRSSHPC
jgi:hypothetical protein